MAIPFVLVALPFIARIFGIEMAGFVRIPFLGEIIRDYIHMGTFGHPLLIIIMYMGALDPKMPAVNRLMSIRKELSIICGFPVLTHSLIRVVNNFPNALKFFTNNEEYLANTKVVSELGAGISSFSYVFGILMVILFIPLWVTSFGAVRRRMGQKKWKKLQRWSYVLYATLFIHAMCIQIGGMLNPRGGGHTSKPATETTAAVGQGHGDAAKPMEVGERRDAEVSQERGDKRDSEVAGSTGDGCGEQGETSGSGERRGRRGGENAETDKREGLDDAGKAGPERNRLSSEGESARPERGEQKGQNEVAGSERGDQSQQTARPAGGGRAPSKGFADIEVSAQTKRYIHLISLILIYGSYLFLRLRKAKKDAQKKAALGGNSNRI
ncbi:MAG: ferric reductase-like transmembrane domain-containing protein [Tannerella sp.]|nr:ferric reductase-like transmembrane domain-containing protein [Tannerella sp.]